MIFQIFDYLRLFTTVLNFQERDARDMRLEGTWKVEEEWLSGLGLSSLMCLVS